MGIYAAWFNLYKVKNRQNYFILYEVRSGNFLSKGRQSKWFSGTPQVVFLDLGSVKMSILPQINL